MMVMLIAGQYSKMACHTYRYYAKQCGDEYVDQQDWQHDLLSNMQEGSVTHPGKRNNVHLLMVYMQYSHNIIYVLRL